MRIVSLLPAATEIICSLGLRDELVGRSHECDFPPSVTRLPSMTRSRIDASAPGHEIDRQVRQALRDGRPLYDLDEERLAALAPDVVVTQAACEVCAIGEGQVGEALRRCAPRARLVSLHPTRLDDVVADVGTVARACGVPAVGDALMRELRARFERAAGRPRRGERPRLAVVEWLDPLMLAGHWVPDVVRAAGAEPVGPQPGARFAEVSWNEVAALQPDAVVVAPCGFDLARTAEAALPWRDRLQALAPRVLLLDGNAYLNRPGPRLAEAAETIAAWLDGDEHPRELAISLEAPPAEPRGSGRGPR